MNLYQGCVLGLVQELVPVIFAASTRAGFGHVDIDPANVLES